MIDLSFIDNLPEPRPKNSDERRYEIEWEKPRDIVPKRIRGVICPDGVRRAVTINGNAKSEGYPAYVVVSKGGKAHSVSGTVRYVSRRFLKDQKRVAPAEWVFIPNASGKNAGIFI